MLCDLIETTRYQIANIQPDTESDLISGTHLVEVRSRVAYAVGGANYKTWLPSS